MPRTPNITVRWNAVFADPKSRVAKRNALVGRAVNGRRATRALYAAFPMDAVEVGRGTYGVVYRAKAIDAARWMNMARVTSGAYVQGTAPQRGNVIIKFVEYSDVESRREAMHEVMVHESLPRSHYWVPLYGVVVTPNAVISVMGVADGVTLSTYASAHHGVPYKLADAVWKAVTALWRAGYAHTDLHSENIIVDPKNLGVKLIDFGLAAPFKTRPTRTQVTDAAWQRTVHHALDSLAAERFRPKSVDNDDITRHSGNTQMLRVLAATSRPPSHRLKNI